MRNLLLACLLLITTAATATWKPEYKDAPQAVQGWFKAAQVTPEGRLRIGFQNCCDQSDRFDTQFRVSKQTAGDEWFYREGNSWVRIPADVIHNDEIHAAKAEDDALPEFEQMRREGVLFIYDGKPTCFWPPQGGI
jgi:hypothetical protein